jgi:hypothetical protein
MFLGVLLALIGCSGGGGGGGGGSAATAERLTLEGTAMLEDALDGASGALTVTRLENAPGTERRRFELGFSMPTGMALVDVDDIAFEARARDPLAGQPGVGAASQPPEQVTFQELPVLSVDRAAEDARRAQVLIDGPVSDGSRLIFERGALELEGRVLDRIIVSPRNHVTLLTAVEAALALKAYVPTQFDLFLESSYPDPDSAKNPPALTLQPNDPETVRQGLVDFFERVRQYDEVWLPRKVSAAEATEQLAELDRRMEDALARFDGDGVVRSFRDDALAEGVNYHLAAALLGTAAIPWSSAIETVLDGRNSTRRAARVITGEVREGTIAAVRIDSTTGVLAIAFSPNAAFDPFEVLIQIMVHEAFHQDEGGDGLVRVSKIEEKIASTADIAASARVVLATDLHLANSMQTRTSNTRLLWALNSGGNFATPGVLAAPLYQDPPTVMPASVRDPVEFALWSLESILDNVVYRDTPDVSSTPGNEALDVLVSVFSDSAFSAPSFSGASARQSFDFTEATFMLVDDWSQVFLPEEILTILSKLRLQLAPTS